MDISFRVEIAKLMGVLILYGADTNWTEPNGAVITKDEILRWTRMSLDQLALQEDFKYLFCRAFLNTFGYPFEADSSMVSTYRRAKGRLECFNKGYDSIIR